MKSYLDFTRPNDMSAIAKLDMSIADIRTSVHREMAHARAWRNRPQSDFQRKAISRHVSRAREANIELVDLLRMKRKATQ